MQGESQTPNPFGGSSEPNQAQSNPAPGVGAAPPLGAEAPIKNSKATQSLVFGILALLCCGIILGPVAIIFGNQGKEFAAANPGEPGLSQAKIGIILGWVGIAISVITIIVAVATQ